MFCPGPNCGTGLKPSAQNNDLEFPGVLFIGQYESVIEESNMFSQFYVFSCLHSISFRYARSTYLH